MTELARAARRVAAARHLVVLTGAGVSAESGVPTFRGAGGLWRGRDPLSLATPEAFAVDPALVWEFYNDRRAALSNISPNPAHHAIASLSRHVPRLSLITQNVDRLHQQAGSPDVIELHGNIWETRCTSCGRTSDETGKHLPALPNCPHCGGLSRPAVVWFGECLPVDAWNAAEAAVETADVLLVVGTSALVYPAASLIETASRSDRCVIEVNIEATPLSHAVEFALRGAAGAIVPQLVPA